jgi:hypothetical protein
VLAVSSAAAMTAPTMDAAAERGATAAIAVTHGADLALTVNAAKVTAASWRRRRHLPGVTQDAGPYPITAITVVAVRANPAAARPQRG